MPPASRPAATLHASVPRDSCPSGRQAGHKLQGNLACMIARSGFYFLDRQAQDKALGHTSDIWSQPSISPKPHCLVCWDADSTHFWQPEFAMRSPNIRLSTCIIRQRRRTIHHNLMAPNHSKSGPQLPQTAPDFFGLDEQWMNGQWHCMQSCDPQNVDTQSQRNKAYCNNYEYNTLYTCERNKTCSIESTIFCIWILGFLANCLEIQSNQPRDFLPPYHTFPPHRWEITTSLQTDAIKCVGQILTSAKAPSTQNLGH